MKDEGNGKTTGKNALQAAFSRIGAAAQIAALEGAAFAVEKPDMRIVATEQSGPRIIIVDGTPGAKPEVLWAWDPAEDPGIAPGDLPTFDCVSECKPHDGGRTILVTASGGAFAAIDVETRRAKWYGFAGENPHSIDVLPDGRVAVVSSTGNKLTLTDVSKAPFAPAKQKQVKAMELPGGHGVHWDATRNCLWAFGYFKLHKLAYDGATMSVTPLASYDYSKVCLNAGGHDLVPDGRGGFFLTNSRVVFHFDPDTETFAIARNIAYVKSFSPSATRGDLYAIPNESWWTDRLTVRDASGNARTIGPFENPRFYKARWLVADAAETPAGNAARLLQLAAAADAAPERHGLPPAPEAGRLLFVAPDGSDAADGSEAHPFATLARARDAVRDIRRGGTLPKGGVKILLRGGRYSVPTTFTLGPEDSGEPGSPISYAAFPGEKPVLDGGIEVADFHPVDDPAALRRIPETAHGKVVVADLGGRLPEDARQPQKPFGTCVNGDKTVRDLYLAGEPLQLARHPNEGFFGLTDIVDSANRVFKPGIGDLSPWEKEPDLMALGYWKWLWADQTLYAVANTKAGTISLKGDVSAYGSIDLDYGRHPRPWFLLNALAALDAPGEWFFDAATAKLYLYPPDGAPAGASYVLSALAKPFIAASGVHDIRIEGLEIRNGMQNGIVACGIANSVIAGNTITCLGGDGLVATDATDTAIYGNRLSVFGHGAMIVAGGDRRTLAPSGIVIENNDISRTSRSQRTYTPGLHLSGCGTQVLHNWIHDIPSSAIRLEGNDCLVAWNRVEKVVTESDDQGAVDMWGDPTYQGNTFAFNLWKDVGGGRNAPCGQGGIRFDDAISGNFVYCNRFANCSRGHFGAVQIHGGRANIVANNIVADCAIGTSFTAWMPEKWREHVAGVQKDKLGKLGISPVAPPYSTKYPVLAGGLEAMPQVNTVAHNLFVKVGKRFSNPGDENEFLANADAASAEAEVGASVLLRAVPPAEMMGPY